MKLFRRHVSEPILALLKRGSSPRGLAWSLSLGFTLGLFPVLGTTTLLCLAAALLFSLNQPAMQLANFLVYPLQLALLIPVFRLGERVFAARPLPLSLPALLQALKAAPLATCARFWNLIWHACVVWAVLAIPAACLLGWILDAAFARAAHRFGQGHCHERGGLRSRGSLRPPIRGRMRPRISIDL